MAYTDKDRQHMFWTQCMAMIAEYMAQQGIDYAKSEATTNLFWDKVTILYISGIKRGIFNLPLDIPKNAVLMGTEQPAVTSKEPETKTETQAKPESQPKEEVKEQVVKAPSDTQNKPETDKKVKARLCAACKDNLTEAVYEWSNKHRGMSLCISCMQKKKAGQDIFPKSDPDPAAGKVTEEELVEEEKEVECVM